MLVRGKPVHCPRCREGRKEFMEVHSQTAGTVTCCCVVCSIVFDVHFPVKPKYVPKEERHVTKEPSGADTG